MFFGSMMDCLILFKNNSATGERLVLRFQITVIGSCINGAIGLKVRFDSLEVFAILSRVSIKAALFLTIKVPLKLRLNVPMILISFL